MEIIILAVLLWLFGDFIDKLFQSKNEERSNRIVAEWEIIEDKDTKTLKIRDRK